ncbi:17356_t:CDS:2 [Gigaspora margarita]|uniref:17356_t:CDS:1 n=1 Tax=Gigaspora margarita TaxID=4874 RepID=A0ABN7UI65_GIGMA|nr:17356_t:CDS:2 [Gigaspora margarita]
MQKRQRKIDTLILTECSTEDYGTQKLENNHIKEKGKEEKNGIVLIEVSREKEKKATAKRIDIEINPISEDTSRHTRPIVTNNKDKNAKERIELEKSYMLWNLSLNFNNTQVKLLMKRYGKMSSINWIFDSFKKRAIVKIAIKNKRSKQILDDSWSLPISRKLTRITQEENEEEVLANRKKHRLILEVKWNRRNLSPDSDKRKKVVNRFSKNASKLNQKNTLYEKKITCSHNKENESGETTKYKNHYDEDKRKEGHNVKRSRYIESLDEKLQIILQRLDKIEANRSRDGNKKEEEMVCKKEKGGVLRSKGKRKVRAEDQDKNRENREEARIKQLKRVTKDKNLMVEEEMEGALDSIWEALEKDKLIIELGRWVRKGKRKIGRDMTKEDRKDFGLFRENIRKKFQIEIENIGRKWKDKEIEDLKQGRMLASLLEKPFNHIVVDKLLENQNNTRVLTCDSEKVKKKQKSSFRNSLEEGVLIAMPSEKNGHKFMPY